MDKKTTEDTESIEEGRVRVNCQILFAKRSCSGKAGSSDWKER